MHEDINHYKTEKNQAYQQAFKEVWPKIIWAIEQGTGVFPSIERTLRALGSEAEEVLDENKILENIKSAVQDTELSNKERIGRVRLQLRDLASCLGVEIISLFELKINDQKDID